jgi:transglutaminase-like putative cysteine protease
MSQLRYRIRHRTTYQYSGRIDLSHSRVHLYPRDCNDQETLSHQLEVLPEPHFRSEHVDYFGNTTQYFSIQQSHESLNVISISTVEKKVAKPGLPDSGSAWNDLTRSHLSSSFVEGIPLVNFLSPSRSCPSIVELDQFLKPTLQPGRETMQMVNELMGRIYDEFDYVSGATDSSTPIYQVLKKKQGVCQDFAHLMIAALRRIGIPARYVSGYLETVPAPGQKKLLGADASHAWVEVYTATTGWVGFDPTNNQIPAQQHLKIGHGRDYFDVQPLRGVFIGSGGQELIVEVDVERL